MQKIDMSHSKWVIYDLAGSRIVWQWWAAVWCVSETTWWRHQMETFAASLAICAGNSPVPGDFPTQRPVTRSFDVFFDLRLNKRLRKQSGGWWFETLSRPLRRHCNKKYYHSCSPVVRNHLLWPKNIPKYGCFLFSQKMHLESPPDVLKHRWFPKCQNGLIINCYLGSVLWGVIYYITTIIISNRKLNVYWRKKYCCFAKY